MLDFKREIGYSVLISLILNVGHIFQFKIYDGTPKITVTVQNVSNTKIVQAKFSDTYPGINSEDLTFAIYSLLYFIGNYLVFLFVNTTIEVIIVRKLHQELLEKRRKMTQNGAQLSMATKRKLEKDSKKEQRAILMVVMNSLINFFLRLSEIFIFLSSSKNTSSDNVVFEFFDSIPEFKYAIVDLSYLTFITTFSTNVYMYYLFNTNFKQAFKLWSNVKKK
jgi:hypothetical protein